MIDVQRVARSVLARPKFFDSSRNEDCVTDQTGGGRGKGEESKGSPSFSSPSLPVYTCNRKPHGIKLSDQQSCLSQD